MRKAKRENKFSMYLWWCVMVLLTSLHRIALDCICTTVQHNTHADCGFLFHFQLHFFPWFPLLFSFSSSLFCYHCCYVVLFLFFLFRKYSLHNTHYYYNIYGKWKQKILLAQKKDGTQLEKKTVNDFIFMIFMLLCIKADLISFVSLLNACCFCFCNENARFLHKIEFKGRTKKNVFLLTIIFNHKYLAMCRCWCGIIENKYCKWFIEESVR